VVVVVVEDVVCGGNVGDGVDENDDCDNDGDDDNDNGGGCDVAAEKERR